MLIQPEIRKPSALDEEESDTLLLSRFHHGDEEAATQLYRRYVGRLQAVAKVQCAADLGTRMDAEDIVQSVFRSFFRRAAQGKYQVPPGEELWKLLVVITLNKVRSKGEYHRAAKRDVRLTSTSKGELAQVSDEQSHEQEVTVLRLLIEELLAQLPAVQRQMVQLRLEGYDFAEISTLTHRSKRTVERVLQDFRQALKSKLDEDQAP